MPNKAQKLKPDIILKNYWSDNERFADLFNAVLFQGEQVIRPEDLEDMDTEESSVLEHREYAESIQAARDVVKIQKRFQPDSSDELYLVMYGLEDQEHIHYGMPLRVMGYDYGSYKKQFDSNAQKYKTSDGLTRDEFLSKMRKTDTFIPVITLVVYYGEKPWDGALSLREMLNIPGRLAEYVSNYKMLLIEARKNDLVLHNIDNRDFFNLLEILSEQSRASREKKGRALEYAKEHKVDSSVLMTVAGAANCHLDYRALQWKGEPTMYSVFEETREEGRLEGRLEGIAENTVKMGIKFNLSKKQILEELQENLNIPLTKAEEYFKTYRSNHLYS